MRCPPVSSARLCKPDTMEDLLFYYNAYRVPAQHCVAILLTGAAWRWGGAPERWLTATFTATMVVPIYFLWWFNPERSDAHPFMTMHMPLDVIAAVLFVGIALNANRNYPLWVAGFQVVALGAHLVDLVADGVSTLALAILISGPAYCQLLLLIAGFVRHVRREQRFGHYRDWRVAMPTAGRLAL